MFLDTRGTSLIYTLSLHDALPIYLAHNLGNLLLLGKIGVFHNRRNASSRLLLLISKHLIMENTDRKSGSAGMPRPISYAVFCLKKKNGQAESAVQDDVAGVCARPA